MRLKGVLEKFLYIVYRCGYSGYCGYLWLKAPANTAFLR